MALETRQLSLCKTFRARRWREQPAAGADWLLVAHELSPERIAAQFHHRDGLGSWPASGPMPGVICFSSECLHAAQQRHQVADLNAFERAHRVLDLLAHGIVDAPRDELVEFLDLVLPGKWMGSEAGIVLHLVLERCPILQADRDLRRHSTRIFIGVFLVRFRRYLLHERLHVGSGNAIW